MEITRTIELEQFKITVTISSRTTPAHSTLTTYTDDLRYLAGAVGRDLVDRIERLHREEAEKQKRQARA